MWARSDHFPTGCIQVLPATDSLTTAVSTSLLMNSYFSGQKLHHKNTVYICHTAFWQFSPLSNTKMQVKASFERTRQWLPTCPWQPPAGSMRHMPLLSQYHSGSSPLLIHTGWNLHQRPPHQHCQWFGRWSHQHTQLDKPKGDSKMKRFQHLWPQGCREQT